MDTFEFEVKRFHREAKIPVRAKIHDAGLDLYATEYVKLKPLDFRTVKTGIGMHIPSGYYGRIADRSGFSTKHAIHNMAGVIDSGYQGEIEILMINLNCKGYLLNMIGSIVQKVSFDLIEPPGTIEIRPGDKIAQIIIEKIGYGIPKLVNDFSVKTDRGEKGFGSSGNR
jgi:dUTP pyrophosphatase